MLYTQLLLKERLQFSILIWLTRIKQWYTHKTTNKVVYRLKSHCSKTDTPQDMNRTQQIRAHRPHNSREPCHRLVSSNGDRQGTRAFYQMNQRSHTHPKGRTTGHEPRWGQLPTEPRIRPLSWHGGFPSRQELEEQSTNFFWWRPLIEVETSSFR